MIPTLSFFFFAIIETSFLDRICYDFNTYQGV